MSLPPSSHYLSMIARMVLSIASIPVLLRSFCRHVFPCLQPEDSAGHTAEKEAEEGVEVEFDDLGYRVRTLNRTAYRAKRGTKKRHTLTKTLRISTLTSLTKRYSPLSLLTRPSSRSFSRW